MDPNQSISPRPSQLALSDSSIFCTKKARSSTPSNKKIPPRPPCKSLPAISRIFNQPVVYKAQAISFRENGNSSVLSKCYDELREESYFNQCFDLKIKIGSGSFGDVYKVRSKEDGKYYAVKKSRERFKGKSDRLRKLEEVVKHELLPKHYNLVEFHRAWEERQHLYIQTELCQMTLSQYAEMNHDIPESTILNYLIDLLMAIKHLHDHRLIHLDIKPDNIFISYNNVCKLGDFGLILDLSKGDTSEATEGDPKYLAKELMQGIFTEAADIFSLGITMLELGCDLDLPSGGEGWHQLRSGNIPSNLFKNLSDSFRETIIYMMHPDYKIRPTADELLMKKSVRHLLWKRKVRIKFTQAVCKSGDVIMKCVKFLYLVLFSHIFQWFWSKSAPREIILNSSTPTMSFPHKRYSQEYEQSFSDEDMFDSTLHCDTSTSSSDVFLSRDPIQSSLFKRPESLKNSRKIVTSSPYSTPLRTDNNGSAHFINSSNIINNLSQRLSFYEMSDDEDDLDHSVSSIGPKNLLNVFEEVDHDVDSSA